MFKKLMIALSVLVIASLGVFLVIRENPSVNTGKKFTAAEVHKTAGAKKPARLIKFGFDLRSSPEEDARQYLPFLKYLEKSTGYTFRLRFTPKKGDLAQDLGEGKVELAAVGAVSFIKGEIAHGVVPLVRGRNNENKAAYQSVIVVSPESPLKKLADLKGKRLAFGSKNSTQGHLIPRIVLAGVGITLDDLGSHEYTGSHQNCANAVISGKADACGMQDTMGRNLEKSGKVRILNTSDYFPSSGIAVNKDLPKDVVEKIHLALINFRPNDEHSAGLYNWHKTEMPNGFTSAKAEDYAGLKKGMIRLDLMN
ncbi:MAG: phosphate/phosphite/phosphonate ABC transporter substrate-binding protein [Rhodospirillales bacterium]|nr:phosphate/phosphite/phosphonate ABC transporter substrate-binding protein [Rhodospirillales bacterium]